ncbi:hypothetical protein Droror1_Dr00011687 [Drosera rotundifolia]
MDQAGQASSWSYVRFLDARNATYYCEPAPNVWSRGVFNNHHNIMQATLPVFLLQLILIFTTSRFVEFCLKPLGQSAIVGQILGGLLLGPSLIARNKDIASVLFPMKGILILETFATFGMVLFSFEMGLKMDMNMMIRPRHMAMTIGGTVFVISTLIPVAMCFLLRAKVNMDSSLANSLSLIAGIQSLTAFQVIACLLTELKILNTDIGRLALESSIFCDLIGILVIAFGFSAERGSGATFVEAILSAFALLAVIIFVVRPGILKLLYRSSDPTAVSELHILIILLTVLMSAFASEFIGQHYALGPLVLGLVLPDGPPLGATLVKKLDTIVTGIMYPTFMTISGLKMNVYNMSFQAFWVVGVIVLSGCIVKQGAVMVPAMYGNIPLQEAFVLGLVMNAKGIAELIVFSLWRYDGRVTDQEFTASVLMVVILSAIITPLIRYLYNQPNQYVAFKRMTIQHNKHESELRIMVCIHNHDNVPTMINILEASAATERSPIAVIGVILVQLVGRSTPIFLVFQPQRSLEPSASRSNQILNAFQHYERQNEGIATVNLFTNMSHYEIMHDDICQIALDKRANIVIVPFHRQWAFDGSVETGSQAVRAMNLKLLEKAPCSIGILIDRGAASGSMTILNSRVTFQVAVIFIGGADDAEALAYGARMACHERVAITVIRFLLFGNDDTRERKRDTDFVDEFRRANAGNDHFEYEENVVRDGVELAEAIQGVEGSFDLILVGRNHQQSQLLFGLDKWSDFPELGVVGDMLAAAETGSAASVLVIQQQKLTGNSVAVQNEPSQFVHDVPDSGARNSRQSFLSISIDRDVRS